jgi:hypothetical protein
MVLTISSRRTAISWFSLDDEGRGSGDEGVFE